MHFAYKMKIYERKFHTYLDMWDFFCNFAPQIVMRMQMRVGVYVQRDNKKKKRQKFIQYDD